MWKGKATSTDLATKWSSRKDSKHYENVLGYGPLNPYVPPLSQPQQAVTETERIFLLTLFYLIQVPHSLFIAFTVWWSGDLVDGHWYNNSAVAGMQMYPWGLAKYYDLYSAPGLRKLHTDQYNNVVYGLFGIFSVINAWMELSWDNWGLFLCVPNPICWYLAIGMEDGFTFG